MGCVLGSEPFCELIVVYVLDEEERRSATFFGDVLFDNGRCRGEK